KSPFPAKFTVGDNNLAATRLKMPGPRGIGRVGIAAGIWNLWWSSGHLTAATFTFQDGRIQHLTPESAQSQKHQTASLSPITGESFQNAIGYVSDTKGVPCISGEQRTDAPKQIATFSLLGAAAAWF